MKYILSLLLLSIGFSSTAEKLDGWVDYSPDYVTNKWIHISITDDKCISIAKTIVNESKENPDFILTGKRYKSVMVKGKYSLKIDCIESANRVHLLTDKVESPEHQQFFDKFVSAYEKFNQHLQSKAHEEAPRLR